ncbi:MAG: tetratricopeptide repeat protein [Edaphocola sp.]
MKHFWGILLVLSASFCNIKVVAAGAHEGLLQQANKLYNAKQYDSAAKVYGTLLDTYPESAGLHYNLGNVYYRKNQVGKAILHYEKARLLAPNNKEIVDNLILANARIQNPIAQAPPFFFEKWWQGLVHGLSVNAWATLALLFLTATLALAVYVRRKRGQVAYSGRWISFAAVLFVITGCMAWFAYEASLGGKRAVVTEMSVPLLNAPQTNAKTIMALPEGTVVDVDASQGGFTAVTLPDGRKGWVALGSVEAI